MASCRDEKAGLLAGTNAQDVEGCAAEGTLPAMPEAPEEPGRPGLRLPALALLAVGALALLAGARAARRERVDQANLHRLVMEQVWQQSTQAEPEPAATYGSVQTAAPATGYAAAGTSATASTGAVASTGVATSAVSGYATPSTGTGAVGGYPAAEPETDAYGYPAETTKPPYTGPLEFSGKDGPPTIAGTKLISAGAENTDALPHAPVPAPPEEYATENPPFTMYMYRAQSETDYPMRNVNTADLAGVLWYLHNEIVAFPDPDYKIRHFNISRIIRFKVTIQNPPEYYKRHGRKFGAYVAFGAGKCSVPHCDSMWKKYGAVVGCQAADTKVANYHSIWKTQADSTHCTDGCNAPLWFSLPGPCPSHEYGAKSADCVWNFPGGDCGKDKDVNGARDCTYFAQWYGQVHLDELLNFTFSDGSKATFAQFLAAGGKEYDKLTDKGVYTNFWDGIHDEEAAAQRVAAVRYLFAKKYPKYPTELQETEVPCDFDGWEDLEFDPDPAPGSQP